jgi:hypothetical protein
MISEDLAKQALAKLKTPTAFDYFFDKLSSAEWIKPLLAVSPKTLLNPPDPESRDGGFSFPGWSVSRYLARVAPQSPEQVLDVIKRIPATKNFRVHEDFMDAALKMPAAHAVQISRLAEDWLKSEYTYFLPEKSVELALFLAKENLSQDALRLISLVIKPIATKKPESEDQESPFNKPKARARFPEWNYEDLLESKFLTIVDLLGKPAIEAAKLALIEALKIESRDEEQGAYWRPAIEDHGQNAFQEVKDHLLVATRDAYLIFLKKYPGEIEAVFRELTKTKILILKRLAFYLAGHAEVGSQKLVQSILLERENLEETSTWHEVAGILKNWFSRVDAVTRSTLVSWIREGRVKTYSDNPELDRGHWQLRMLSVIESETPEELKELFKELVSQHGTVEHPDFHSYHGAGWVGPTSPISSSELSKMAVTEVLEYLRKWEPSKEWFSPSVDGLGRQLVEAVKERPEEFLSDYKALFSLNPTYCRSIIEGLGGTNQKFSWEKALDFCLWIVTRPNSKRASKSEEEDPGFDWARTSGVRFLQKAFDDTTNPLPISLKAIVWQILEPVTKDPDPTDEREAQYLSDRNDYYQHCINTTRGTALETVVQYSLWVRRRNEIKGEAPSLELIPEVKTVLERHLDLKIDPQVSIRAVYGRYLPWLALFDGGWTQSLLPEIFPKEPELKRHFESAWFTYIVFCGVYDSTFALLYDYYSQAVQALGKLDADYKQTGSYEPNSRLAEHIVLAYGRGLKGSSELVDAFFKAAPKTIRAHAIDFIGRSLKGDKQEKIPEAIHTRFQKLWEKRAVEDTKNVAGELKEFGWWFVSGAFEPSWAIDNLTSAVERVAEAEPDTFIMETLEQYVISEPMRVLKFAEVYAAGPVKKGNVWFIKDHFRQLLQKLKAQLAPQDQDRFKALINRLGAAGYLEFRDLISEPR